MSERIAFAACFKLNSDPQQRVWQEIAAQQPDHLLLLGDQIYMDFQGDKRRGDGELIGYELGDPANLADSVFEQQMRLRYQRQLAAPGFRALVEATLVKGKVDLVWDDHDFGFNNAIGRPGGEMDDDPVYARRLISGPKKAIALKCFNEFRRRLHPRARLALDRRVAAAGAPGHRRLAGGLTATSAWLPMRVKSSAIGSRPMCGGNTRV